MVGQPGLVQTARAYRDGHATPPRSVRAFERAGDAEVDNVLRAPCVIFDMHNLYWTIPTELTIHEVSEQITIELARLVGR